MDIQTQSLNTTRHAYRTADYQVSKQEMAALWRRYYVWSAYRNKALQIPAANIATPQSQTRAAHLHRAYRAGAFHNSSGTMPPQSASPRHAYQMLNQGVHKPGDTEVKRHAYESTCNFVTLTVS